MITEVLNEDLGLVKKPTQNDLDLSIEEKHASLEYLAMNAIDLGLMPSDIIYVGLESEYSSQFHEILQEYAIANNEYLIDDTPEDFIVKIFRNFGDEDAYDFFQKIGVFAESEVINI